MSKVDTIGHAWEFLYGSQTVIGLPAPYTLDPSTFTGGSLPAAAIIPVFNVTGYGAVGNGIADDTDGIQVALDEASAAGGGIAYAPAGTYRLMSRLTVPAGVILQGAGMSNTTLRRGSIGPMYEVVYAPNDQSGVCDLTIDGRYDVLGNDSGMSELWLGGTDSWAERIKVRNFSFIGVGLHGTRPALRNSIVVGNALGNTGLDTADGFVGVWACEGSSCESPSIIGNHIRDCHGPAILVGAAGFRVLGNVLTDNHRMSDITGGGQIGTDGGVGAVGGIIAGNVLSGVNSGIHTDGIELGQDYVLTTNNDVHDMPAQGIVLTLSTNQQILNNLVHNCCTSHPGEGGIYIAVNRSEFTVSGNRVWDDRIPQLQAYGVQVVAGTSDHYIITDNDLRGNLTGALLNGGTGTHTIVADNLPATANAGVGYTVGIGAAVIQLVSKSDTVTINALCGRIETHNASLGANTSVTFLVNNTTVISTDVVLLSLRAGAANFATYQYWVDSVQNGYFFITLRNVSGGALGESIHLNFAVIKAVGN